MALGLTLAMLFVSISFALGIQGEPSFRWNMGCALHSNLHLPAFPFRKLVDFSKPTKCSQYNSFACFRRCDVAGPSWETNVQDIKLSLCRFPIYNEVVVVELLQ